MKYVTPDRTKTRSLACSGKLRPTVPHLRRRPNNDSTTFSVFLILYLNCPLSHLSLSSILHTTLTFTANHVSSTNHERQWPQRPKPQQQWKRERPIERTPRCYDAVPVRGRLPLQHRQVPDHRKHPARGRAVCQCLLRHRNQNQDVCCPFRGLVLEARH